MVLDVYQSNVDFGHFRKENIYFFGRKVGMEMANDQNFLGKNMGNDPDRGNKLV